MSKHPVSGGKSLVHIHMQFSERCPERECRVPMAWVRGSSA